ncbi:MAG: glycosyltransferase family 4 protein [Bacteroidota bacterium]|nr:glycosyltransferase family 4 protein [Bacteroidota bacterium]
MKILQLCKKFPFPLKDGESIAVNQMSKALVEQGCELSLLAMNTSRHRYELKQSIPQELNHYNYVYTVEVNNDIKTLDAFKNLFSKDSYHISRFVSKQFEEKLIAILNKYTFDIIQLETLYLSPYLNIIKKHSDAMVVMRAHNIEHEIWDRITHQIKFLPKKVYLNYLSKKLKNFEVEKLNGYDFLVAITDRDLNKFRELGYKNGCIASPVGFDLSKYQADYSAYENKLACCFIGSLDWIPNIEGLKWFFNQVWPLIHAKFPSLTFHFTGRNDTANLSEVKPEGTSYYPNIDHSVEFINQFPVMLVPLLSGSGIRVKILEGMALGKVVITTTIGLEGIPAIHKEEVFIADTPEEFLSVIQYMYKNPEVLLRMGQNARKFVETHFDSHKIAKDLVVAYKTAMHAHAVHE